MAMAAFRLLSRRLCHLSVGGALGTNVGVGGVLSGADAFHQLFQEETNEVRRLKLTILFQELQRKDEEIASKEKQIALLQKHQEELKESDERGVKGMSKQIIAVEILLLEVRGMNHTRGMFERLQREHTKGLPKPKGDRSALETWLLVIKTNPDLKKCLEEHVPPNIHLPTHIASIYHDLSTHIHAEIPLEKDGGTILFHPCKLKPDQIKTLVCLGKTCNIPCAPAPPR